jgi:hypothetical protein
MAGDWLVGRGRGGLGVAMLSTGPEIPSWKSFVESKRPSPRPSGDSAGLSLARRSLLEGARPLRFRRSTGRGRPDGPGNGSLRDRLMNGGKRVVVTGVGVISPLGASPCDLWDAVLEGRSAVRRLSHWEATGFLPPGAEVEAVSRTTPFRDRVMAEAAMDQALSAAELPAREVGLYWGAGLDSYIATADGPRYRAAGDCFRELASRAPRRMVALLRFRDAGDRRRFRLIRWAAAKRVSRGSTMLHPLTSPVSPPSRLRSQSRA